MSTLISSLFKLTLKLLELKLERHCYEPLCIWHCRLSIKVGPFKFLGLQLARNHFIGRNGKDYIKTSTRVWMCDILDVLATCLARYADDEAWYYNSRWTRFSHFTWTKRPKHIQMLFFSFYEQMNMNAMLSVCEGFMLYH